ncbi:hypothetical protein F5050DRAFT_1811554 [Lentinula boryana]|uniref:Uncharacterized protein n=1 Tax=Lentinula boryana TaxID=40481 RepID=A0ABQ8Q1M5_9AGAR|nr:hypothetical protein F5050DRAFT_1811554 [Lentinula boryana]
MSLHHWRTPLYSHERAAPSRSSYVTAGEKPLFSVSTAEELEQKQCGNIDPSHTLLLPCPQDQNTEASTMSPRYSGSMTLLHHFPFKDETEVNSTVGFCSAPLSSSVFLSPASLHQEFDEPMQGPMQVDPIDHPFGITFPLGVVPEDVTVFMPDPFKFESDYEHDKTPLSLQLADLVSVIPTNSLVCSSTASEDFASSPSERGISRTNRIQSSLDILRAGRISPVEFLTEVLDVTNPRSAQFRGKLYSKTNKRLDDLLDKIVEDPMGEAMVEDWFRRHGSRKRDSTTLTAGGKENVLYNMGNQYYHRH